MRQVLIRNNSRPAILPVLAYYCDSFICRLRGLMFYHSIGTGEGLIMVQPQADRLNAAIHMFFMNFDITTVWLDNDLRIVDTQVCKRWHPVYIPAAPARYVMEIHATRKDDFLPGDQLSMETC